MTMAISPLAEIARDLLATSDGPGADRKMAELDWFSLLLPDQHGGVGGHLEDALAVLAETARAGFASDFLHNGVLAPLLLARMTSARRGRDLLDGLGRHDRQVVVVLDAAVGEAPSYRVQSRAGELILTGHSAPLAGPQNGAPDAVAILTGPSSAVLLDAAVVSFTGLAGYGPDRLCRAGFDDIVLPPGEVIELEACDAELIVSVAAMAVTAQLVGSATRVLELTLAHARSRRQFGRTLGAFQAVQMRCADLALDVDATRCILDRAVGAYDAGDPAVHQLASMAKSWADDAVTRAMQAAHTVHGAIGFSAELGLHRHTGAVLTRRLSFGSAEFHRARVARSLTGPDCAADGTFDGSTV